MRRLRALVSHYWFRSLHRRIALVWICMIAVLLAAQSATVLWLIERSRQLNDLERAERLSVSRSVATQLADSITNLPSLDLDAFVKDAVVRLKLRRYEMNLFVVMADGRVVGSPLLNVVMTVTTQLQAESVVPRVWEVGTYSAVSIFVRGKPVGVVGITPFSTLQRFGWQIAAAGLILIAIGPMLGAVLIGRPIRSRVRGLKEAASRLGQGDLSARASLEGVDEITELAESFNAMADDLSRHELALQTSDRLRRQLIADVSHELMTPLTVVLGHLETLAMPEVNLDAEQRLKQVNISRREAHRLERVVRDLLDTTRLEAGGGGVAFQEFPASELLDQVRTRHSHDCHAHGITLVCSLSPDSLSLDADPFRLEQALGNIVSNAVRHTPRGGTISVRFEGDDDFVVLSVTDTGEGIPETELPFIFERFYRASSRKREDTTGSGLGLSIVRAIVERHGGFVKARSTRGVGTTIEIHLRCRHGEGLFANQQGLVAQRVSR